MATHNIPLQGAIANLNWFDAQRKHYETPDQIARRFRLPDDAGMRAFCQGAASLLDRGTAQFIRRLPATTDAAWSFVADHAKAEQWLFGVQWNLRQGAEIGFRRPCAGMAAHGEVADVQPGQVIELSYPGGGWSRIEVHDVSSSSRARRDIANYSGPLAELRLTDRVPANAGVVETLQDTNAEQIAQPGGVGTHCVGVIAGWHRAASLAQKLAFEERGMVWPPELAVGLDIDVLVAAYYRLIAAYHQG